jgi:hypothetical protein
MSERLYTCCIPFGGGTLTVTADLDQPDPLKPPDDCTITTVEFDDVQWRIVGHEWLCGNVMAKAREDWCSRQHDRAESLHDRREERNGDR